MCTIWLIFLSGPDVQLQSNNLEAGLSSTQQTIDTSGNLREENEKKNGRSEYIYIPIDRSYAKAYLYFLLFHAVPLGVSQSVTAASRGQTLHRYHV